MAEAKCSSCGAILKANAKFCPSCGSKQVEATKPRTSKEAKPKEEVKVKESVLLQRSVNPLPNVQRGLPPEVVRKAFFTQSSTLPNHFSESRLHAARAVVDRVHYRNLTQRLPWKRSESQPITKAQCCEYHSQFIPRSLENHSVDNEVAQLFLTAGRSSSTAAATGQKLSTETAYQVGLPAHTKDGRGQSYKPENPIHIDINGRLLETVSALRRDYPAHDKGMASRFRGERVTPFSNAGAEYGRPSVEFKTQFKRDFSSTALGFRPAKYPSPVAPSMSAGAQARQ